MAIYTPPNGSIPGGTISLTNSEYVPASLERHLLLRFPCLYVNADIHQMYSRSEGRGWAAFPKRIVLSPGEISYDEENLSRILRPNCDHLFRFALFYPNLWNGQTVVFPIEPEPAMENEQVIAVLSGTDSPGIFRASSGFVFPESAWFAGVPLL